MYNKIIEFLKESKRIFSRLSVPSKKEYEKIAKITGLAILVVGVIGVLMSLILNSLDLISEVI